jgi:hypothetical protein
MSKLLNLEQILSIIGSFRKEGKEGRREGREGKKANALSNL